jgi:RNA polymerase sigma-70 factor (ECF subfamily)
MSAPLPRLFHVPDRDAIDAQLVARVAHGDAAAFREIFDAYAEPLVLYARSLLKGISGDGLEVAEDIVHDLFTHLWTHKHTAEIEVLRTYLYRAARNRAWSVLRHERVKRLSESGVVEVMDVTPAWQRTDAASEGAELSVMIERALASLPDRPREIWRLSRVEGMSHAEIGDLLGVSVKTIETHMTRALKALRVALKDWR